MSDHPATCLCDDCRAARWALLQRTRPNANINHHEQCKCDECVASRRAMLLRTHPIHAKRDEDVAPTLIPVDQALAMALEERDDLRMRLAQVDSDIKVLRDCSQWGIA